jgi:glycosyltransferase involved in cell wall biosynthesis
MRVGQITYSYKPLIGGGDIYAEMLAALLVEGGHSQRVFQRMAQSTDADICFVPNPLARLHKGEFWTQALFLPLLRRELQKEDLLIAHYPIYALMAAHLRRKGKPALIGISHGVTWDERPGSARARLKRLIAKRAFRLADGFVANDSYFLREMGLAIAPRDRLYSEVAKGRWFIPNCIPPNYVMGRPIDELRDLKAIIVPRNLYRNRGIHLAIEAFHTFAARYPETHLLILGDRSQPAYAESLEQRVKALGLAERVQFRGHIPHAQMADFYASAELCLIPSICGEGTSLAALEAMACGLAVISTDVAGLKDLPTVQCAPEVSKLAETMLQVYPDKRQIGIMQKEQVARDYSYSRWAEAWSKIINQVSGN